MRVSRDEALASMRDEAGRRAAAETMLDAERRAREVSELRYTDLANRPNTPGQTIVAPTAPVGYQLVVTGRDGADAIRTISILPIPEK